MAILKNSCDALADSTVVTVGNSGGAAGQPWTQIPSAAAMTVKSAAAADGSRGYELTPVASTSKQWIWDFDPEPILQVSVKFRPRAVPTASHNLVQVRHSSANAFIMRNALASGASRFNLQDAGAATLWNAAAANMTVDQWYRLEAIVEPGSTGTSGRVEAGLYLNNSLMQVAGWTGTGLNLGGATSPLLTNIRFGRPSPATTDVTGAYWDSFQVWTGDDVPNILGQPWDAGAERAKITLSHTTLSMSAVLLEWDMPLDAPDGVSLIRIPGVNTVDSEGRIPSDVLYNPSGLPGAVLLAEELTGESYADEGLVPGTYTYVIFRSGED